jgi:hypothetical protein
LNYLASTLKINFILTNAYPSAVPRHALCLKNVQHFLNGQLSLNREKDLDDFLLAGKAGTGECLQLMDRFRIICEDLGVPLAEDKTIGPSSILTFLGLEIDTLEMVIRIPQCKLSEVKEKLESALGRTKITLLDL